MTHYAESFDTADYRIDEHRLRDGDVLSAWAFAAASVAVVLAFAAAYVM